MTDLRKDVFQSADDFAKYQTAPMVSLQKGGQFGHFTDISQYVASANYIRKNLICVLMAAPLGFDDLENPKALKAILKHLVEVQAKSIEGLNATITVDYTETPVGGAGEMQEDVSNVTRQRSSPTFTWTEKYGKPINAFLEYWIFQLLGDPESKIPQVVTRGTKKPTDLLPDYTGASMLFIETDMTGTKVLRAWLCTNMHPKTGGQVEGRRDMTSAGETIDYSVEFTSLTQHGVGVNQLGQKVLDGMNLTYANPNKRPAFMDGIDSGIGAQKVGYIDQVNSANKTFIK